MSVVAKCAVTSQKLLIVPGLQKLLEEIVPVQTLMEKVQQLVTLICNSALKLWLPLLDMCNDYFDQHHRGKDVFSSPKGPLMQDTQLKKDWQDLSMLKAIQYLRLLMKLM